MRKRDFGLNERIVNRLRAAGDKQFISPGDGEEQPERNAYQQDGILFHITATQQQKLDQPFPIHVLYLHRELSAGSRASRLCVHPFDPLGAECWSHERIRKVLCFPGNLVVPELHDAYGVGRLGVICQDEFGDPKVTAADDSSDSKPLLARLAGALGLYVASTPGSLA